MKPKYGVTLLVIEKREENLKGFKEEPKVGEKQGGEICIKKEEKLPAYLKRKICGFRKIWQMVKGVVESRNSKKKELSKVETHTCQKIQQVLSRGIQDLSSQLVHRHYLRRGNYLLIQKEEKVPAYLKRKTHNLISKELWKEK